MSDRKSNAFEENIRKVDAEIVEALSLVKECCDPGDDPEWNYQEILQNDLHSGPGDEVAHVFDAVDEFRRGCARLENLLTQPVVDVLRRERWSRTLEPSVDLGDFRGSTVHQAMLKVSEAAEIMIARTGSFPSFESQQDAKDLWLLWVMKNIATLWNEDLAVRLDLELTACSKALGRIKQQPAKKTRRTKGSLDLLACAAADALEAQGKLDWNKTDVARAADVSLKLLSGRNRHGKLRVPDFEKRCAEKERDAECRKVRRRSSPPNR